MGLVEGSQRWRRAGRLYGFGLSKNGFMLWSLPHCGPNRASKKTPPVSQNLNGAFRLQKGLKPIRRIRDRRRLRPSQGEARLFPGGILEDLFAAFQRHGSIAVFPVPASGSQRSAVGMLSCCGRKFDGWGHGEDAGGREIRSIASQSRPEGGYLESRLQEQGPV